ncbi:dihydroorotate dehydrogenase [Aureococcus anophagefferens]|nr:dihydroorotate dehydrogenase [Aureococcus anophagefferens]
MAATLKLRFPQARRAFGAGGSAAAASLQRGRASAPSRGQSNAGVYVAGGLGLGLGLWLFPPANEYARSSSAYWSLADWGAGVLRDGVGDAETAHGYALAGLHLGRARRRRAGALKTRLFGLEFPSPVGVAAGFDKRGEAVAALGDLGFGFVEVGGVTPEHQDGNPRPRVFRLKDDEAVVNFVGLPSEGVNAVAARLDHARGPKALVGANITKNATTPAGAAAVADHVAVAEALAGYVDFVVVNASCPNVKGGVVSVGAMPELLRATKAALGGVPLLLKCSPDLGASQVAAIAKLAVDLPLDGLVVANTTARRPATDADEPGRPRLFYGELRSKDVPDRGGLSGPPLRDNAVRLVRDFYAATGGAVPIVGVGGVASAADAAPRQGRRVLVQLGARLPRAEPRAQAPRRPADLARRDGRTVQAAVGADRR